MSLDLDAGREQSGFTLVELMMVVLVMSIFGLVVQTSLSAFQRTARGVQDKSTSLADVRTAEEAVARDLRAANPVNALAAGQPMSTYDTQVQFDVYCSTVGSGGCSSQHLRHVTYQVVGNTLQQVVTSGSQRALVGPIGFGTLASSLRPGAVINDASEPIFQFLDKNGSRFLTDGSVPSTTFRDCTKTVVIDLKVIAEANSSSNPINLVTKVELRNFNDVPPC